MTLEQVFSAASAAAMLGWLMLAVAPLNRGWAVFGARMLSAIICGSYATLLATNMIGGPAMPEGAGFGSLAGVVILFSSPGAVLIGWIHYLAFDLFIGSWEVETAPAFGLKHWMILPCLFLTLMYGPVGLLLYWLLRVTIGKRD
jgi:hypothetical protein